MNKKILSLLVALTLLQVALSADCDFCKFSADGTDSAGACTDCDPNTCTKQTKAAGAKEDVCTALPCP